MVPKSSPGKCWNKQCIRRGTTKRLLVPLLLLPFFPSHGARFHLSRAVKVMPRILSHSSFSNLFSSSFLWIFVLPGNNWMKLDGFFLKKYSKTINKRSCD